MLSNYYLNSNAPLHAFLMANGFSGASAVLNVGCAGGSDSGFWRANGTQRLVGVEPVTAAAQIARMSYDQVYEQPFIECRFDSDFDCVVFADSLEHMIDSAAALDKAVALLRPGGRIVLSLPNVRHISVWLPLIVSGDWAYRDAGILDRTHLRFFTRKSVNRMVREHGLRIDAFERWGALSVTRRAERLFPGIGEFILSQMFYICGQATL